MFLRYLQTVGKCDEMDCPIKHEWSGRHNPENLGFKKLVAIERD